jgi:excisionase family DNA binding protein
MSDPQGEPHKDWLGLGAAAQYLGVHAVTLRRWADAGEIGTMRTAGGHRRFALAEVKCFAAERRQLTTVPRTEQIWADTALLRTQEVVKNPHNAQWMEPYDEHDREQSRLLGRRLMAIVLQTITTDVDNEILLAEARTIGGQYALSAMAHGLSISTVLEATISFRDAMFESALLVPEVTHNSSESNARLLKSINTILNAVQLSVANTYDRSERQ